MGPCNSFTLKPFLKILKVGTKSTDSAFAKYAFASISTCRQNRMKEKLSAPNIVLSQACISFSLKFTIYQVLIRRTVQFMDLLGQRNDVERDCTLRKFTVGFFLHSCSTTGATCLHRSFHLELNKTTATPGLTTNLNVVQWQEQLIQSSFSPHFSRFTGIFTCKLG